VQGNEADGYDTASQIVLDPHVYTGAAAHEDGTLPDKTGIYLMLGDSLLGYDASNVRLYRNLSEDAIKLYSTERANPYLHLPEIFGRNVAVTNCLNAYSHQPTGLVWYVSTGVQAIPLRYTLDGIDNLDSFDYLDMDIKVSSPPDARFTVSAAEGQGLTGIGLVSSISSGSHYLEWSNFGKWEELPMPPADTAQDSDRYMNQGQLLVDDDGRWHIIYRDFDSDAIYIRSTT
jgi:hypothetical protein